MARQKKVKLPKLATLPVSIEDRKLLDSYLNEAAEYKSKIKYYTDLLAGVKQSITNPDGKLNLDTKYASQLIEARYDFYKQSARAEVISSSVEDIKILQGSGDE